MIDAIPELIKPHDVIPIKNYVASHVSGLDFIPAVGNVRQIGQVTKEQIQVFFRKVVQVYDYVVVDLGGLFSETALTTLDVSNLILLIATPDVLAVYQVKWGVEILQNQHFPMRMIRLVLNRAESHGGVASQEVQMALGLDVIGRIPSDGRIVGLSLNRGVPAVVDNPRSRVATAFHDLARSLEEQSIYVQVSDEIRVRATQEEKKKEDFWEKFGVVEGISRAKVVYTTKKEEDEVVKLKKRVHEKLVEKMNLRVMTPEAMANPEQAAAIKKEAQKHIIDIMADEAGAVMSSHEARSRIVQEIINEALGLGALEEFLADPDVTDIMVNSKDEIYVEKGGKLVLTNKKFMSDSHVRMVIERIIAPLGRRIDESVPMVDARTPEGSRINAIIPPLSLRGPMITIRKFAQERLTMDDLIYRYRSIVEPMAKFIEAAVVCRMNILVSGGTGSGKTTLLNIISHYIPDGQRIITIEDAAELKINKDHWARLESRPPNLEGRGQVTIRDLFVNTLRMRPDRIIIGECRGAEVLDMLQAMNTGHDGSLTTIHANSTRDAITRLNSLILLSGLELPLRAAYEMIASALNIVVHVNRGSDGRRRVVAISELTGELIDGIPEVKDIFIFDQKGIDSEGNIIGDYRPTGYIPGCYEKFLRRGIDIGQDLFTPQKTDA